jgi:hypothetical protein
MSEIHIIPSQEIDESRWNACLMASENRMIYAEKIYLDHMADHWEGLVMGNYKAIFPLPWRKKWGIRYGYQPAFIQQLGIFAPSAILTPSLIHSFLQSAQQHVRFAEISLNHHQTSSLEDSPSLSLRTNYILPLDNINAHRNQPHYNDVQEKLRRAGKWNIVYDVVTRPNEIINVYQKLYQQKQNLRDQDYIHFNKLMQSYAVENRLIMRKVSLPGESDWLAAVLMVQDGNRLYNLASCLKPEGRSKLANYVLYDHLIQEMASSGLILDFEGSDLPGIAYFYEQFSPQKEQYPFIRWNQLPVLLKWVKG